MDSPKDYNESLKEKLLELLMGENSFELALEMNRNLKVLPYLYACQTLDPAAISREKYETIRDGVAIELGMDAKQGEGISVFIKKIEFLVMIYKATGFRQEKLKGEMLYKSIEPKTTVMLMGKEGYDALEKVLSEQVNRKP